MINYSHKQTREIRQLQIYNINFKIFELEREKFILQIITLTWFTACIAAVYIYIYARSVCPNYVARR